MFTRARVQAKLDYFLSQLRRRAAQNQQRGDQDPRLRFYAAARTDPVWREVRAVQAGHLHFVPDLPFSWFDNPPAANRLIGLLWLGKLLYPASFQQDIRTEVRRFYALFYQQEPSDAQLDGLLANPPA
jgi:iron complex transport system substrate-binding protein